MKCCQFFGSAGVFTDGKDIICAACGQVRDLIPVTNRQAHRAQKRVRKVERIADCGRADVGAKRFVKRTKARAQRRLNKILVHVTD